MFVRINDVVLNLDHIVDVVQSINSDTIIISTVKSTVQLDNVTVDEFWDALTSLPDAMRHRYTLKKDS